MTQNQHTPHNSRHHLKSTRSPPHPHRHKLTTDSVFTSISVNGIHSHVNDIPARNGAWHVLGRVLCPPHHHHEDVAEDHPDGEWAGWET